ncbi:solute carrier family 45 member 3-like [Branchiostoma floridae x Branchiostoma japonicum]
MDASISALWRLLLLNSLVFGIEVCVAAGFNLAPALLLKSGMERSQMSLVLGVGPFLALILVPAIGVTSDQCRSSLGRRRPFILILSFGICLSLLLIYHTFMMNAGGSVGYLLAAIDWENSFLAERLQVAHFFMWAALLCYIEFFSDFVGEAVYPGRPHGVVGSEERKLFDQGVRMASFGLLIQCVTATVSSMFLEIVVKRIGERKTLQLSMAIFTVGMTVLVIVRTPLMVVTMSSLTGLAMSAVNSIPFNLVGTYHERREIFFAFDSPATESSGVGAHMAALNTSYYLAQIMLSVFMGYIVHITRSVTTYITCAALLGMVACFTLDRRDRRGATNNTK